MILLDATTRCIESVRDDRVIPSDMSFVCVVLGQHNKHQNEPSVNKIRRMIFHPNLLLYALITEGQVGQEKGGNMYFFF